MTGDELRARQAPIKAKYKDDPASARATFRVSGTVLPDAVGCRVASPRGPIDAGLHPLAGGDSTLACSAEMLLESLVGCAGTTLKAVATAMGLPVRSATVVAEADMDFRGTLGVAKDVPIGLSAIRLRYEIEGDLTPEQRTKLIALTERYCVIAQTLAHPPKFE